MSLNRWKVLACTLTIGVGGLAVFATPPSTDKAEPKEPAPLPNLTVKPASPANGTDTPALPPPAKPQDIDLVLPDPVVTPPARPEETTKPPVFEAVFEPIAPPAPAVTPAGSETKVPAAADTKAPDAATPTIVLPPTPAKPETPATPKVSIPVTLQYEKFEGPKPPAADLDLPPVAKSEIPAPVAPTKPEPGAPTVTLPPPMAPAPVKLDTPPVTPPSMPPETVKLPALKPAAGQPAKLKMLLRMGDGQPRFEIRNSVSTELLLKVYGEKIEMQAPPEAKSSLAGVTAMGRVRFTAPGLDGTCDHLTILSGTGEVLLKGNIHLKSKRGKAWSEMTAEKMVYQIGTAGLSAPGARNPVTPASYIPD